MVSSILLQIFKWIRLKLKKMNEGERYRCHICPPWTGSLKAPFLNNLITRKGLRSERIGRFREKDARHHSPSLLRRSSLTAVSNVCEAAPRLWFWAPTDSTNYRKCVSNFLQPDWQISNGFLTGHSWRLLKSWYTGRSPEQGFGRCFADGFNKS